LILSSQQKLRLGDQRIHHANIIVKRFKYLLADKNSVISNTATLPDGHGGNQ